MEHRPSLAIVTETFPPEVNGVAMTWGCLTAQLLAKGCGVLIIRPRQGPSDTPLAEKDRAEVLVRGIPLPRYPGLKAGLPAGRRISTALRVFRPDLLHIVTEGMTGWSALRVARKQRVPVTSSFHTNFHAYGKHYGFGLLRKTVLAYLRTFHNRTLATFAPTREMCVALQSAGFRNTRVLGRGIDTALFHPKRRCDALRREWGVDTDAPVVLYVGRIAGEKNIPLAVEAFKAFRENEPRARFVLVGDGPERSLLESGHPEFIFAGMRRGEDLARHYASGDLLFAPSVTETFGNIVTEGLASGLSVLTFDYAAGRQHIRDGLNGFLVPHNDSAAFVERARILGGSKDRWNSVRVSAARGVKGLTWSAVTDRFLEDLHSLTTRNGLADAQ